PGQTVAITGGVAAAPLLREIARAVTARGGYAVLLPTLNGVTADLLHNGSDDQLTFISPIERFAREEADVLINVRAETNTRGLSGVDPARQRLFTSARTGLAQTYMQRAADGDLDWKLTLYPTDAYAMDADMETEAYTDF